MSLTLIPRPKDSKVESSVGHADLPVQCVLQPHSYLVTILGSLLDADHFPPWHDLELPFALIRLVQALMVHGFVQPIKQFRANDAIVGGPVGNGGLLARCRGKLIERVNPFGIEDLVYAGVV